MSWDLMTALDFGLDADNGSTGREIAPQIVELVDRRGRRLLVPVHSRLQRSVTPALPIVLATDATFSSGTIH